MAQHRYRRTPWQQAKRAAQVILPSAAMASLALLGAGSAAHYVSAGLSAKVSPVRASLAPDTGKLPPVPQRRSEPRPDPIARQMTYVVRPGDTLSAIAYRYCGNEDKWEGLRSANRIPDPAVIQPGEIVVLAC